MADVGNPGRIATGVVPTAPRQIGLPGFSATPRHDPEDTRAIAEYNQRLNAHPQLVTATVPLRDGVAISVKRAIGL